MRLGRDLDGLPATVRVIVLHSTSPGGWHSAPADDAEKARAALQQISGLLARPFVVSISLVRGTISGAALTLALACDLRFSEPGAVWKIGSVGMIDTKRQVDLLGYARASALSLTQDGLSDAEAITVGLSRQVRDLTVAGQQAAAAILARPHSRVTELKALLQSAPSNTWAVQYEAERAALHRELADEGAEDEPGR